MDRGAFIAGVDSGMLEARLNDIAHNLANVSTPGYKASRTAFAAVLARGFVPRGDKAAYPSLAGQRFDLRPGELRATGRALD
ncbi:MAG: flagellar hook basal-body protein, partial [Zetaproteobacteria bacterium]